MGDRLPSLNESTPWQDLPSVSLTTISQIIMVLLLLASLGYKDTISLTSVDLESAYYQVPLVFGQAIFLGFQLKELYIKVWVCRLVVRRLLQFSAVS